MRYELAQVSVRLGLSSICRQRDRASAMIDGREVCIGYGSVRPA